MHRNAYVHTAVLAVLLFASPFFSQAAVLINEVAWMGTDSSSNDEWIELFNDGSESVSVDGWELTDNVSLSVSLTGSIGAGEFAVLERTDDDSAPGTAFMIYTGALGNDGRTLVLKNTNGSIHDQVAGGENWEHIGGDNTTKETAQLSSGGWVTAAATPGAANATAGTSEINDDTEDEETKTTSIESKGNKVSVSLELPDTELSLTVDGNVIGYVNNLVYFSVEPDGLGEKIMDSLTYTWNFGDGMSGSGKEPMHQYRFPGNYVAVVEASFGRHVARERMEVTVLPVAVSLELVGGNILMHNNAGYEVDVSGMRLADGTSVFTLPPHTIMLPNATLTFSRHMTDFQNVQHATLFDQRGNTLAQTGSTVLASASVVAQPQPITQSVVSAPRTTVASKPDTPKSDSTEVLAAAEIVTILPAVEPASTNQVSAAGAAVPTNNAPLSRYLIYLALVAIIAIGTLALYARPQT